MSTDPSLPQNFADGVYGPATTQALVRFQQAYGLTPDGKYGPQTAAALSGPVSGACR
ncbi:peptidoglycan-binding domain-containing protein [Phaeobacter sp. CAU 1743]|uniref:peptidoglycan-binding domain-containing protein n=1 Tax=Phaeobacter sp. CAU 1743 TaxID=3140367 RepID=UPI00325B6C4D